MNHLFSSQALNEIRRNISHSLADTFQMMFQMDIRLVTQSKEHADCKMVHAYMHLAHKDMKAILSLALSRNVVKTIADAIAPDLKPHGEAILQDIVCEITNIVGNHLRSYLYDKMGLPFTLGLPQKGLPAASEASLHALALHFRIENNENLDLDFTYLPQQKAAG